MAERRMLSRKITDHDNFTTLPAAAQALYMHLVLSADDDGLCSQINIALGKAKAKQKDLKALVDRRYLIKFDSGVYAIKHWGMQNRIRQDRYHKTDFPDELSQLTVKPNGAYTLTGGGKMSDNLPQIGNQVSDNLPQDDGQLAAEVRLGKDRVITGDMCVNARAREEESDDGFEAFWAAYPRKVGGSIQQAFMEYVHVTDDLGVSPSVLIDAAREQGKDLTPETARYFPGAEKWLRNRGWEQKKPKARDGDTNNIFLEIYQEEHNG